MKTILFGTIIEEYSIKAKSDTNYIVCSVTNTNGFQKSSDTFDKQVFSENLSTYKKVFRGSFAYNPSRINVGSIGCQDIDDCVLVSPLYNIFKINKNITSPEFVSYFFKSGYVKNYIRQNTQGTVRSNFKMSEMSKLHFPNISLNEQNQLLIEFRNIERIISKDMDQLNLLDELIKSRFVEMFGDPITNNKGWDVKDLNEITDVRDGTHDSPKYVDIGYPFVTSKNLVNGNIDFSTCQLISKDDLEKINQRSFVDDGDILMPMIGTIGGAIIVKKDRDFAIKNVALIKFNKENSIVDRKFILNVLNSDSMNDFFNSIKKGGTQNFISLGLIRKIPTIIPPLKLQNEFALFVEQVDKLKFSVQKHLSTMQELLHKKMDEYFN